MKKIVTLSIILCSLLPVVAQNTYKGKPLILAEKESADIGIEKEWYEKSWRISPKIEHDTFTLVVYSSKEDFGFRTDRDSIKFSIKPGETKSFYVKLGTAEPAHTVVTAVLFSPEKIMFENKPEQKDVKLFYEKPANSYYDSLRRLYPLTQLIKNDRTDTEKVLSILHWTHHQWKHDGGNAPKGNDAISILNEARAGGRFPCFAYSIVLRDQLIAYGYKARVLYIKTKDAETRQGSPGHVVTEVFLNDKKKWCFVDGQFNVMPTLNGIPLNAIEFQQAINGQYDKLILSSKDAISKRGYIDFIYSYLYYFDTSMDNRISDLNKKFVLNGKTSLMLVPLGAPELTKISFWNSTINYCVYTHSAGDFYAVPK